MIALKYAFAVSEVKAKNFANSFNITGQQVNEWFTGKKKIPVKYHEAIESLIGIDCQILQLEITDDIKRLILENEINKLAK